MSYNNLIPSNYKPHKPTTITTSSRTVLGRKELEHKYTRIVRKLNHLQKRYTKLVVAKSKIKLKLIYVNPEAKKLLKRFMKLRINLMYQKKIELTI